MFGKEEIKKLEQKIDQLSEKTKLILERQNSQYTDIMLLLKDCTDAILFLKENVEGIDNRSEEEIYEEVKEDIIEIGKVSTSYIQRSQRLGYVRAVAIIDMLEERGVIEKQEGSNTWKVVGRI
ncbi:MAG: segregation ATPase FtsK/SpoIIIE, family [Patescibacteria group bacterium]|jgi:S-DNA-T family DNA segregation ATPase FtsK/SpoIIIE|nr:segregation ATPase FtsK/SpoIIIE, family [Patescibacteria group bacterium]